MTAEPKTPGHSPASDRESERAAATARFDAAAKVRVGNPFVAERTGKCGLRCNQPIRRGDNCVIVSSRNVEGARAIVHLTCAQKDDRLKGLLRDLTVDDLFAPPTTDDAA